MEAQKTGARLTQAVTHRKTLSMESEHLNLDCLEKAKQMESLLHERDLVLQKLNNVNSELDCILREENHLHHSSIDLETQISRLQTEKRELLDQIERLTILIDTTGRDFNLDRGERERTNDWHVKLIVSKVIF